MTNLESLEKAIRKAITGGWTFFDWLDDDTFIWTVRPDELANGGIVIETEGIDNFTWHPNIIIFDHDFAKALWPKRPDEPLSFWGPSITFGRNKKITRWQYHLQQMVIADDPIKYLGENI